MAIIKEYKIGNTRIKIADDYIRTDPKEIEAILARVASIALEYYARQNNQEESEETH